jgi:two-component system, NtrC family, nitrogen regulation sensor histidine kinase GlnL
MQTAPVPVLDALVTWVAMLSEDGHILWVNAALQDALGASQRQLQGKAMQALMSEPLAWSKAMQDIQSQTFQVIRYDAQLLGQQKTGLPVHVILSRHETDHRLLLEMLPVAQQTQQEREARLLEQALSNKALIRNLAHEVKNPLGGIRGAAQLLQYELSQPDLLDYTQLIIHEVDRLQSLVDRLLAPHKKLHVQAAVNIHEVCERVRALVLAQYHQGLQIERDYDVSIPPLRGDPERLIQAVLNLVQNAAQVLHERRLKGDANILLCTRVARQVTLGKQRHKLALQLHVIDNGPGIPDEIKDHIFSPLVTGRDDGTGLGLTLAQTIVHQHQGLIEVESRPGRCDFKITLPLT